MKQLPATLAAIGLFAALSLATPPGQYRLLLEPNMVSTDAEAVDFSGLADEQRDLGDPPAGEPKTPAWKARGARQKDFSPSAVIDLGREMPLATLWVYDTNGKGELAVATGRPGAWASLATYDCGRYKAWASIPVDRETRYLRLTLKSYQANFAEVAVDAYSAKGWAGLLARRAEAERKAAERAAALKRARQEALKRPLVEMAPYGTLSLVDEVNLAAAEPGHSFADNPTGCSRVAEVLGRPCRVIEPVAGEASYLRVTVGRMKLLRPGGVYVLAVEYPEDAPRSMVVVNSGNEVSRGFHTGGTVGDALHTKYVSSHPESLDVPLSGRYEQWSLLIRLHDRFAAGGLVRGSRRKRTRTPEDGFEVTVAQFSRRNDPLSAGVAVRRIRLFEVVDPDKLAAPLSLPPQPLPRRRLFWREEMADGVIGGKTREDRGLDDPLDWYRHKAELMQFLGMNTFSKDLLEFGACQHWDPRPYGGNQWVYFNSDNAGLWERIVDLMGTYGFDVLPYYEYAGSKGGKGLGSQRRAKPLTRNDAYTHIKWIENANADITDPDTYEDFRKMLDLTVIRMRRKADFAGIWIRPRSQLPVGFGPATLKRFADQANDGKPVTREDLRKDTALYERYLDWWHVKRREFLVAMRDYLRANGVEDAMVLFTGCPAEAGVGFGDWQPRLVTELPDAWKPILAREAHKPPNDRTWEVLTPRQVVERDLYLKGLLSPGLNWGDWEVHHARPADDPARYKDVDGVMLTHAFNRLYTVASPKTLDLFRSRDHLAMVRHYCLNENMMFDRNDQSKLGYFVADVERAGPTCMLAEALAVAHGDPHYIGYLVGGSFARGFPRYARAFNRSFLALPALPGRVVEGACDNPAVVVRAIPTAKHGTWYAVVNAGVRPAENVIVRIPGRRPVTDAVSGERLADDGKVSATFHACELRAWHVK